MAPDDFPNRAAEFLESSDTAELFEVDELRPIFEALIADNPQSSILCGLKRRFMSEEELDRIASSGGGLGRRLKHAIRGARTFDELAAAVKTKAYTRTRTDRLLAQILLGIQRNLVDRAQVYIRPLAMNRTGARLLKEIREEERSDLPIVTKPAEDMRKYPTIRETLAKDIYAQDLFLLLYGEDLYTGSDYVRHPFVAETEKSF